VRGRQLRIVSFLFAVILAVSIPAVAAFAQTDGPDYVGAKPPSTSVGAAVAQRSSHNGELPRTGMEIGTLALTGVGLVVVGRVLMGRRRTGKGMSS